jgi:hypothetical protein
MRGRLPAGLRWRLLLALLATSAVTLGVAALVVLPPLQDRLREQSIEGLETAVNHNVGAFERKLVELEKSKTSRQDYRFLLYDESNQVTTESPNARVLVQDRTTQPADPDATGQGFVFDSELSRPPRRALHMAVVGAYGPVTELDGDSVLVARPLYDGEQFLGVLVAERELTEASALVALVHNRFLIAAAVGPRSPRCSRSRSPPRCCAGSAACGRSRCGSPARGRTRRRRATSAATRSATSPAH